MHIGGPEGYSGELEQTAEYLGPAVVSELNAYFVKSLGGTSIEVGRIGRRGFEYDRNWMVTTREGDFLTQREIPEMALVKVAVDQGLLRLTAPGMPDFELLVGILGNEVLVNVWKSHGVRAVHQGSEVASWLSKFLGIDCQLVAMADDEERQVDLNYAQEGDMVGFADGYPFLLISEGSFADLNSRLAEPLPMNRFRPNLVVKGVSPYAEDTWRRIKIGDIEFDVVKPCARCKITTTNQSTAEVGREPLKTLATYRRHDQSGVEGVTGVLFGQNLVHRNQGVIRLGDRLEVLEFRS